MIAIITAIISGIAMSVQGVFNTRLGEKIGVWETNVFVQGSALTNINFIPFLHLIETLNYIRNTK